MAMVETNVRVTREQRAKTLELFLEDLKKYTKKNRRFFEASGMQDPMWYVLGTPPYAKKVPMFGSHPRLESRIVLLPQYLLFLTEWTPEKAANTKRISVGSFLKEFASEGISELSWGVSDLIGTVANAVVPAESIALLGKKPEEMLSNPWSLIIPLGDIVGYELYKASFFVHYLSLHVKHRFEGNFDVGITYHLSGAHSRADGLYKKLRKGLGELPQSRAAEAAVVAGKADNQSIALSEDAHPQGESSLPPLEPSHKRKIRRSQKTDDEHETKSDLASPGTQNDKQVAPLESGVGAHPKRSQTKHSAESRKASSIKALESKPTLPEVEARKSDNHNIENQQIEEDHQHKQDSQAPRKGIWSWLIAGGLFMVGLALLYLYMDARNTLDSTRRQLSQARDTIETKDEELRSLQSDLDDASSQIVSLNSEIDSKISEIDSLNSEVYSLNSTIDGLNSRISDLNRVRITRVDVTNNNCTNIYIFVDGRLATGTRAGGYTYFYVPPGSYEIQYCTEPSRSNCGSPGTMGFSSDVFDLTVQRSPTCP